MPSSPIRILLLEDDPADAELTLRKLSAAGLSVESDVTASAEAFKSHLRGATYHVILCDFRIPGWNGLQALRWVRQSGCLTPFICVSGTLGEDVAVECIKQGATDYVLKANLERLPHAVRRALDEDSLRADRDRALEEVRSLEHQFRGAQRMEAVGRLAGGVAHDFNNMLMVINSSAQMLEATRGDAAQFDKYMTLIRVAADRAALLTRQLLAFSRRQVLQPTILDLNVVVGDISKMLSRLLPEDIDVVTALDPRLSRVSADRGQLEQVIVNLVVNARDAMPGGGRLTIETADVYLDGVYAAQRGTRIPAGPYVMLAVSDSGIGMTADVQARLFEPFFTTKEIGKGTGLGLATVYGIVKQSGGFVWVYSELGIGSAFKVYLPRTEAGAETERAVLTETPTAGGSETILLVEDEESLRKVASEYLRSKGYTVVEAVSGDEALQVCHARAQTIDVLVANMVMPGRRGPEVAAAALAVYPRLRVIYMSGYTDHAIDAALLGTNAVFLQKPFSLDALGRTVRGLLDGPRES